MTKLKLLVLTALVMLAFAAPPARAGEWVSFPATWAWCDWYRDTYWCYLENEGVWSMVNPDWQNAPSGG